MVSGSKLAANTLWWHLNPSQFTPQNVTWVGALGVCCVDISLFGISSGCAEGNEPLIKVLVPVSVYRELLPEHIFLEARKLGLGQTE